MSPEYAFLDHPGPIPFAHRGGARDGLENTLPAFEHAVELGYRYLETDVRATADGVLLAFHDQDLERVTDRRGDIARLPHSEVSQARVGGREPIPLLEDVLGAWPRARFNIDVKAENAIVPLTEALRRTNSWDRVCVTSFSSRRLRDVRARMRVLAGREVCAALGPRGVAALRACSLAGRAAAPLRPAATAAPCAQVPHRLGRAPFVTPALVAAAHALGLQVHVWTVNDAAAMGHLLDLGVDGIITDEIETLREIMKARGLWATAST
ncbi:glycerophosphodiester phosphodiesterase [Actinomadura sp. DC4]|uniref:glycerophosphodiester phosphodiesterase n=1 Tax=Actinomadura sp. DC4 TaxID=3055069 RepID=UPI0025B07E64|nr:glycerophosphodiester phosphodiesterase [Actinomadura sp. DC4]MDN3356300.1 glycerophosphodiester phosphodiesterase [Actinomadura sp. DC4]